MISGVFVSHPHLLLFRIMHIMQSFSFQILLWIAMMTMTDDYSDVPVHFPKYDILETRQSDQHPKKEFVVWAFSSPQNPSPLKGLFQKKNSAICAPPFHDVSSTIFGERQTSNTSSLVSSFCNSANNNKANNEVF